MQKLPLNKSDYNRSVMTASFISGIRKELEAAPDVTDILFTPKIKGYDIGFTANGSSFTLNLKISRSLFGKDRLKVRAFKDGKLIKNFKCTSTDEGIAKLKA